MMALLVPERSQLLCIKKCCILHYYTFAHMYIYKECYVNTLYSDKFGRYVINRPLTNLGLLLSHPLSP